MVWKIFSRDTPYAPYYQLNVVKAPLPASLFLVTMSMPLCKGREKGGKSIDILHLSRSTDTCVRNILVKVEVLIYLLSSVKKYML